MRERMQNDKRIRFLPCAIFIAAIGCLCSMLTGRGAMLLWLWSGITALIGLASVTVLLCGLSCLSRLRNRPGKRANESDYRKV